MYLFIVLPTETVGDSVSIGAGDCTHLSGLTRKDSTHLFPELRRSTHSHGALYRVSYNQVLTTSLQSVSKTIVPALIACYSYSRLPRSAICARPSPR